MKKQPRKQVKAEQLYFIGLLPPDIIKQEVTAFKQQALDQFKTSHALTSAPHITLIPPFRSARTSFAAIAEFVSEQKAIEVHLKGFNKFDQKVIFVDVVPNPELTTLQKDLELYAHYYVGVVPEYQPFHPHITVAFKDLKRPNFPEAWAYFSEQTYERTFAASSMALFKYNGKAWDILEEWSLGQ